MERKMCGGHGIIGDAKERLIVYDMVGERIDPVVVFERQRGLWVIKGLTLFQTEGFKALVVTDIARDVVRADHLKVFLQVRTDFSVLG